MQGQIWALCAVVALVAVLRIDASREFVSVDSARSGRVALQFGPAPSPGDYCYDRNWLDGTITGKWGTDAFGNVGCVNGNPCPKGGSWSTKEKRCLCLSATPVWNGQTCVEGCKGSNPNIDALKNFIGYYGTDYWGNYGCIWNGGSATAALGDGCAPGSSWNVTGAICACLPNSPSWNGYFCVPKDNIIGRFLWTFPGQDPNPTLPQNWPAANIMGISYSGLVDASAAVKAGVASKPQLRGVQFIAVGGEHLDQASLVTWTQQAISNVNSGIASGLFAGYSGIAYDVEFVATAGLYSSFSASFAAAKKAGFKVALLTSNSAPKSAPDAAALMKGFLSDANIDYIVPRMYDISTKTGTPYIFFNAGARPSTPWNLYKGTKAMIVAAVPSYKTDCPTAIQVFSRYSVALGGCLQWS